MESFVQMSVKEYEELKRLAERQDISVQITRSRWEYLPETGERGVTRLSDKVHIDLQKLKLQICSQQGISPKGTVEFYWG